MTVGKPLGAVPPVHRLMSPTATWYRSIVSAFVVLALASVSCTGGGDTKPSFRATVQWEKCPSDVEIQYFSRHRCGWLNVLQDRSRPAGKTIRLLVVETWPVGEIPLPGVGSGFAGDLGNSDSYADKAAGATRTHHIGFTLERRGTGHSQPSLDCPEVDALDPRQARVPTGDASLLRDFLAAVKACHDRLTAQGVVPADYDVQNVAQDMDNLRVALGIDRWAFLSSYGTNARYLFEYLRAFPGRVGATWMDSPQFPQVDEVSEGIVGTRYALNQFFKACADDALCATPYPDLRAIWQRALARLQRRPLKGSVTVDAGKLLRAARFTLGGDGPQNLTMLPAMIAAAARGRLDPQLATILANDPLYCSGYLPSCTRVATQRFSLGVYLTVLCRDEAPFIDPASLVRETAGDPTFKTIFVQDPYLAACKEWSVPPADPTTHQPVHTDVPQLLFSGQFDSFSPPPAVEMAAKSFENAWVLQIPGQTHNALGFSDCPIGIRNAWIRSPMAPPADTTCLNDMGIVFQTEGA